MDYSKLVEEGEAIERVEAQSKTAYLKNVLMANLFYIVLWIGFDIFFIYVISTKGVTEQFWFVTISVAGLNLLKIWMFVFKCLKDFAEVKTTAYAITDKAVYFFNDGKFKDYKRIAYSEIITIEKSEYYYDGFYIASADKFIKVINTNEQELFVLLAEKIKQDS